MLNKKEVSFRKTVAIILLVTICGMLCLNIKHLRSQNKTLTTQLTQQRVINSHQAELLSETQNKHAKLQDYYYNAIKTLEQEHHYKLLYMKELIQNGVEMLNLNTIARITNYAPLDTNAVEGMCFEGDRNITSTGIPVHHRTVAVDPQKIPYGTLIRVDDKIYIAQDTGGAMREYDGVALDLFTQNRTDAFRFGVQYDTVAVVGFVDPLTTLQELEQYIKTHSLE